MTIRCMLRSVRNTAGWGVPAHDSRLQPPDLASQTQILRLGGLMSRCGRNGHPRT